jgi:hypothetical protein
MSPGQQALITLPSSHPESPETGNLSVTLQGSAAIVRPRVAVISIAVIRFAIIEPLSAERAALSLIWGKD